MLGMQLRVPESSWRRVGLARRRTDVVLERSGNSALLVNFHHGNTDQEVTIADGVGDEIIGTCAKTANACGSTRHFDALECSGGVAYGVVAQIEIIEVPAWETCAKIAQHPAQSAAISGKLIGAPIEGGGVHARAVLGDHIARGGIVHSAITASLGDGDAPGA